MARGTKKRYFKKNKTRNNKKIRKQRRMKKSNKSRKRKQIKKSRKRKAGLKYYQLTKEQREWLKSKHLFNNSMMRDPVDEVTKHALANIADGKAQRRRGFYTTYIKKPKANKEDLISEFDLRTTKATDKYIKEETARKESVKKAAIEELYMTIQNAMNKLNNNISDEETTITAIQNAINIAEYKGVKDEDDAMIKAKQHLDDVYRQLEEFIIKREQQERKAREREKQWRRAIATVNKPQKNISRPEETLTEEEVEAMMERVERYRDDNNNGTVDDPEDPDSRWE